MHIDLEQADPGEPIRGAICLIGAGVAGLVLATRLAASGTDVILLEAGGLDLEDRSQALYRAEMGGELHTGTTEGRFRTLGGSSTRWGGQLLSYPEDILHPVAGSPSHPWPIATGEIEPFYPEVLALFGIPPLPFDDTLLPALGHARVSLAPDIRLRYSRWAPFHRRNLAHTLGRDCLQSPRIRLYTHANVAELLASDRGVVESARVLNYQQGEFRVQADRFILCCGTIESSRLLLLSPTVPDPHGQIGRGFGDHISVPAAVLGKSAKAAVSQRLGPFVVDGILYTPKLEATSVLQRDRNLLAVMAHFTIEEPEDSGIGAVRNLLTALQRRQLRQALTRNLVPLFRGVPDIVRLSWALKFRKRRGLGSRATMRLNIDLEQTADSGNRITLSEERDPLGLRKAVVHWAITEQERTTVRRFLPLIRERLEAVGIPPFEWDTTLLSADPFRLADTYHPFGGLRMGTSPTGSVVDPNLQVHGTHNLFVASCAAFPSGGSSNPTFTLIALALRLAEHLRSAPPLGTVTA